MVKLEEVAGSTHIRGPSALPLGPETSTVLAADRAWLAGSPGTAEAFLAALRGLCYAAPQLAFDIWVSVFPQIWFVVMYLFFPTLCCYFDA